MKKMQRLKSFIKTKNLKNALIEENIAKSLDMIAEIRDDKRPEVSDNILLKIESRLIFILNNISLDKKTISKHFNYLTKIVQEITLGHNLTLIN